MVDNDLGVYFSPRCNGLNNLMLYICFQGTLLRGHSQCSTLSRAYRPGGGGGGVTAAICF